MLIEWIYILMYCTSTHGNPFALGADGPECQPLGLHRCATSAFIAVDGYCDKQPDTSHEMDEEEKLCRAHYWAVQYPVESRERKK